jgi:hypothetical protein
MICRNGWRSTPLNKSSHGLAGPGRPGYLEAPVNRGISGFGETGHSTAPIDLLVSEGADNMPNSRAIGAVGCDASDLTIGNSKDLQSTASRCAACLSADILDDDLNAVIAAWPHLPEAIKVGIVAMVNVSRGYQ